MSKYDKLDDGDADDDDDDQPVSRQEKEAKPASRYSRIKDEKSDNEDKFALKPKSFSLINRKHADQSDRNTKDDIVNPDQGQLSKNTNTLSSNHALRPRRRRESSSSHADEDSISEPKGTEFHYRELDDEYGSRPSAVTSVAKPKDHDVISIISTSSQEYDPAPKVQPSLVQTRNIKDDQDRDKIETSVPDPIIGHEHGVRPLLDDDELENAYEGQQSSRPVETDEPCISETETPVHDDTMSPVTVSPVPKTESTDIFGAAPFKRKTSRKKRPNSEVFMASKSKDENLYKLAELKPPVPVKPSWIGYKSHMDDTYRGGHAQKPSRNRKHGEEMSVSLITKSDDSDLDDSNVNDMFGSAPFMKRSCSSADTVTQNTSSIADGFKVSYHSQSDQIFNTSQSSSQRIGMENSLSADSLSTKSYLVSDSFGIAPFSAKQSVSANYSNVTHTMTWQSNNQVPQNYQYATSPVTPPNIVAQSTNLTPENYVMDQKPAKTPEVSDSQITWTEQKKAHDSNSQKNYKKFKDEMDSDLDEIDHFEMGEGRKYSKKKIAKIIQSSDHKMETSAFSNMSFNDDFDEEELELQATNDTMSSTGRDDKQFGNNLNVAMDRQTFNKEPSPVNQDSVQPGYGGTWPRKRHKLPSKSQATAAPFTVKKRVDSIFK